MKQRSSLQKVFEGILSSQSFELLSDFSDEAIWITLRPEERELLAQLFLLHAEKPPQGGKEEQWQHAKKSYQAACSLSPKSARSWFRLGSFLALSENMQELQEAYDALEKAVAIEARFFDAQCVLGSVCLRLAVNGGNESLFTQADAAFLAASTLVEEKALPADFYWHWGIVWCAIAKRSGEPVDMKKAIELFSKAQAHGCHRPEFLNDYANIMVELALAVPNDDLIYQATLLYTEAIETSKTSSEKEKAFRFFSLGCCYQHLFEATCKRDFFLKADHSFEMTTTLEPLFGVAWERWGLLLFRGWRIWREERLLSTALFALKTAEKNGFVTPVGLATISQALIWLAVTKGSSGNIKSANKYAKKAMALQSKEETHPEPYVALALCQFERGKYFGELSLIEKSLHTLSEGLALFPRSVILWHAIATTKWTQADFTGDLSFLQESLVAYAISSHSFLSSSPQFHADWGVALLDLAEFIDRPQPAESAIVRFEQACEMTEGRSPVLLYHLGRAFCLLGQLQDDEECFERAISYFTEASLEDEDLLPAIYHLALSYLYHGELSSDKNSFLMARLYFEELLSRDPEDELAWIDYALVLVYLGGDSQNDGSLPQEWFQAEEALTMAEKLGQPYASYHKACLRSLMGNYPDAMESLYTALEKGELPDLKEIMEDMWLEPLTRTPSFQDFLKKVKKSSSE